MLDPDNWSQTQADAVAYLARLRAHTMAQHNERLHELKRTQMENESHLARIQERLLGDMVDLQAALQQVSASHARVSEELDNISGRLEVVEGNIGNVDGLYRAQSSITIEMEKLADGTITFDQFQARVCAQMVSLFSA